MSDITFVSPRYGVDVIGGAESAARALATRLSADGMDVAVLTSRARSYMTWDDAYPEGTTVEDGVSVSRFSVDRPRSPDFADITGPFLSRASEVATVEGLAWIDDQGPTSSALLDAIAEVHSGVLVLTPYLYHPTVRGVEVATAPTILHAAAHPEPPMELPLFRDVFASASALVHYSRAEQELVLSRFPATLTTPQIVLGLPVEAPEFKIDPLAAREDLGLGDEPFIIYLGRVTRGKGALDLVARFTAMRERRGGGKLILAGPVIDEVPETRGVVCVGPVSEEHKFGLLAAADALVNPSLAESFSIVVLEAWLAGTPVLVNGWCGPTREHCELSGGGLWYTGYADFDRALNRLLDDAEFRSELAQAGQTYVKSCFSWPAVRRRYQALLSRIS